MFLSVQEQFENLFDPDTLSLYMEIGEHLMSLNYNVLGPSITEIMRNEQSDIGRRIDIHELYISTMFYTLSIYGVRINKQNATDLTTLFNLAKLIKRIEEDESSEAIVNIVNAEDNYNVETFIALSEYLCDLDSFTILRYVDNIHPLFFERVVQHHGGKLDVSFGFQTEFQDRTRQWLATPDVKKELGDLVTMFADSRFYGFELEPILTIKESQLMGLPDKSLAYFLRALALASNLPEDAIQATLERWVVNAIPEARRAFNVSGYLGVKHV